MRNPVRTLDAEAEEAFEVHSALLNAEARRPSLRDNPRWKLLRMDAYETFHNLFIGNDRDQH